MFDLLMLGLGAGFFFLALCYAAGCDRL